MQRSAAEVVLLVSHATDRGYCVVVLGDCCESITDEMQAFALAQILPIIGGVVGAEDFARAVGGR